MSATRLPYLRIDTSTEGLATPPVRVLVPPSQSSEIPNYSLQEAWTALTLRIFLNTTFNPSLLIRDSCHFSSVSSVTQLCPTLCDPMNCSMPVLPVHHQLPEFTQTHVHWVSDAIQSSYSLLSPSPPALNLSQHQGLFKWVSSSHQVAKILEFQLQHQPSLIYMCSKHISRELGKII